jgi:predicted nucleic acid-binding protein
MLTDVRYLVDTSAIVRLPHSDVAEVVAPLAEAGQVATCATVDLQLFSLVTGSVELDEARMLRAASFHWLTTEDADLRRALEVQRLLADDGRLRVGWPALVVAAVAERHQADVLHYDPVFDRIAKVTGQLVQWVVPEGTDD